MWLSRDRFEFRSSENLSVIAVTPSLSLWSAVMRVITVWWTPAAFSKLWFSVSLYLWMKLEPCCLQWLKAAGSPNACSVTNSFGELTLAKKQTWRYGWVNKEKCVFYILSFPDPTTSLPISSLLPFTFRVHHNGRTLRKRQTYHGLYEMFTSGTSSALVNFSPWVLSNTFSAI